MTVEFISAVNVNPANKLNQLRRAGIDLPFISGGNDAEQAREGDHRTLQDEHPGALAERTPAA